MNISSCIQTIFSTTICFIIYDRFSQTVRGCVRFVCKNMVGMAYFYRLTLVEKKFFFRLDRRHNDRQPRP